jgi:malate synthase
MAPFIPSRKNPEINAAALAKVRDDKRREVNDGFDGTWVAHPDLVPTAQVEFDRVLGERPNQVERKRDDVQVSEDDLLDFEIPGGEITEDGLRLNISVGVRYLDSWLKGVGAAAIDNLMEDAATAEIARSQLWLWRTRGVALADGRVVDGALYERVRDEELARLGAASPGRLGQAAELLDRLVLDDAFAEFLTLRAYALLE